jgi:hypothetical protein
VYQNQEKSKKVTTSQDDDFVGACNIAVWMCRKDERAKKSQALGMTKEEPYPHGKWLPKAFFISHTSPMGLVLRQALMPRFGCERRVIILLRI